MEILVTILTAFFWLNVALFVGTFVSIIIQSFRAK